MPQVFLAASLFYVSPCLHWRTVGGSVLCCPEVLTKNGNHTHGGTNIVNMTATEARETIREIMTAYDNARKDWIARFGSDEGFNGAFTRYILSLSDAS